MSVIGHDTVNDKRVNILNYEDPRAIFKRGQIVCRYCKEELVIRGNSRISVPKYTSCTYQMSAKENTNIIQKVPNTYSLKSSFQGT